MARSIRVSISSTSETSFYTCLFWHADSLSRGLLFEISQCHSRNPENSWILQALLSSFHNRECQSESPILSSTSRKSASSILAFSSSSTSINPFLSNIFKIIHSQSEKYISWHARSISYTFYRFRRGKDRCVLLSPFNHRFIYHLTMCCLTGRATLPVWACFLNFTIQQRYGPPDCCESSLQTSHPSIWYSITDP